MADLGTEMYVPGYKVAPLTELLLPWMQQDFEELHPDGCMVPLPQTARPSTPKFCSNLQFHGLNNWHANVLPIVADPLELVKYGTSSRCTPSALVQGRLGG